jgi:eukaryotic-like serine/threonine-protein kinase
MIGTTISHYRILEKIGEGGMGQVYRARDTHLDRFVALKILPAEKVADPERKLRFVQEAKAASSLNHSNIVTIHDIDNSSGVDFIAMEYVVGRTLDRLIGRKGLQPGEALKYGVQIADALSKAHSAGIIHRDLKPSNIMVTEDGVVKVLDFGLAKLTEAPGAADETATLLTTSGTIVGTAAYMSPEQAEGKPVDARSDIFSFGSLLYEMVTGRRAFCGDTTVSTLAAIIRDEPPAAVEVPTDLSKIISRCLRKEPDRRFQHMADLKVALDELKAESDSQKRGAVSAGARRLSRIWLAAGVFAVAAAAALGGLYLWQRMARGPGKTAEPAIAVLPFANLSGDKENEYFSDGLAEEVINALTTLPGLRVVARTSAFAFRGREQDIREIGTRLNVGYVLEGSVRRAGNRIRITAQLINVADGYHLWSERYDREMTDVFAIQDAICRGIVDKLQMQLAPDRPLVRPQTENVKAYQLCLNGVYQMNRFTPDTLMKAKEYFEQAIAEDPRYPMARIGLGLYFLHTAHFGFQRPRDALARARELASKALEIDDGLPLGHALLGMARAMDYDWPGAGRAFRRALELNRQTIEIWPGYDFQYLVSMRRLDEAFAASRRALEQDPLSPFARWRLAYRHYVRREFDLAIKYCRSALELDPNYLAANDFLGLSLLQQGKSDEALQAIEKSVAFARRAPFTLGELGFAYAVAGQTDKARRLLAELNGFPPQVYVPPSSFGRIYLGLGEIDHAFDWIEKAVDDRDGIVAHVHVDPQFDRLRTHPRYGALLLRMNLPSSLIKP